MQPIQRRKDREVNHIVRPVRQVSAPSPLLTIQGSGKEEGALRASCVQGVDDRLSVLVRAIIVGQRDRACCATSGVHSAWSRIAVEQLDGVRSREGSGAQREEGAEGKRSTHSVGSLVRIEMADGEPVEEPGP